MTEADALKRTYHTLPGTLQGGFARIIRVQLAEGSPLLEATMASSSEERQKDVGCFIRSFTEAVANQLASRPLEPPDVAAYAALFS